MNQRCETIVCVPKSFETNTPLMSRREEQASEESLEAAHLCEKKSNVNAEVHSAIVMILSDIMIVATRVLGTPKCDVVTHIN